MPHKNEKIFKYDVNNLLEEQENENNEMEIKEEEDEEIYNKRFDIDEYIEKSIDERTEGLSKKFNQQEFYKIFEEWVKGGRKDKNKLNQLIELSKPVWIGKISVFGGDPRDLQHIAYAKNLVAKALMDFDPDKSKLNTYLWYRLSNLPRFVYKVQNIIGSTERDLQIRNKIEIVKEELENELGREPSEEELAERLGVSIKKLKRIQSTKSPIVSSSLSVTSDEDGEERGVGVGTLIPEIEKKYKIKILDYIYNELSPEEKVFMENFFGMYGKKQLPLQEASKKAGMSLSRGWKLANEIKEKLNIYIRELNL